MNSTEARIELRESDRFLMKEWVFAIRKSRYTTLGRVVDIGRWGLSFHYVPPCTNGKAELEGAFELDLFEANTSRHLIKLPCASVYNTRVYKNSETEGAFELRRCGVQFRELTPAQVAQLERLICRYTTAAEDRLWLASGACDRLMFDELI